MRKISSTGAPNNRPIWKASGSEGRYRPFSIEFTVWRDTPRSSPNSACDHDLSVRRSLTLFSTMTSFLYTWWVCQELFLRFRERCHHGEVTPIEVEAVCVGSPCLLSTRGDSPVYSGIAKKPVPTGTTLWLSLVNLAGDGQADLTVHGGLEKAVYAYPGEHRRAWEEELGEPLGDAPFGENLSTRGALEQDVLIGDVWRWDGALLQVCQPRWPCFKLALYRRRPDVQAIMRRTGRTGWYLRVLEPGEVTVGSPVEVVERDPRATSVFDAHLAMGDRQLRDVDLVRRVASHPALAAEWTSPLLERLAERA
jgi:MOSC domain-containing protein YiiM